MDELSALLPDSAEVNADDLSAFPAKGVVYLLLGEGDAVLQLLSVKNFRASLKRRLSNDQPEGPSKRVDLRAITQRVRWRRADSNLELDWIYLEAARLLFPENYSAMTGFRPAWWVHCNPATRLPRFTKTNLLEVTTGQTVGPLRDSTDATKLIQTVEGLFDLCRDYSYLQQAPGKPCPWKQMDRCVGPCDGSIGLDGYRALVAHASEVLTDPDPYLDALEQQMHAAAAIKDFESAELVQQRIEAMDELADRRFRFCRPVEHFRFLAVLPGPRARAATLLAVTPGRIVIIGTLMSEQKRYDDVLRVALEQLNVPASRPIDTSGTERLSLVSQHLFTTKTSAVLVHRDDLADKSLLAAYRQVTKKRTDADEELDDEGVLRES